MSTRSIAATLLLIFAAATSASGQQVGDPVTGKALAESKCAECHASPDGSSHAPAFSAIARMPSTTALGLNVFLQTSHPPMPNLTLGRSERDDLVAYILSLR